MSMINNELIGFPKWCEWVRGMCHDKCDACKGLRGKEGKRKKYTGKVKRGADEGEPSGKTKMGKGKKK